MRRLRPALWFCFAVLGLCGLRAAEPKLTLADGDRVLLIGDTLIERENNYGALETKLRQQFPGRKFSVRNLGYSGDTPLGASRASFDPVAKGTEQLKEQLKVVQPSVAIIGYGMAASLEEMTYRRNDPALNPDPARYGTEHSPAKLKRELQQLVQLIRSSAPGGKVRFVFLGPVRHEDLRDRRPGLPDPAEHNASLARYEQTVKEVADELGAPFVRAEWQQSARIELKQGTDNGIHLTERGYRALAEGFAAQLGWTANTRGWDAPDAATVSLREAILRKNSLFFHRSRPANYTYIFGFRKREQGRNAVEIPKFDPLVEAAEADVQEISAGRPGKLRPVAEAPAAPAKTKPLPRPDFKLSDGLNMTVFAENPHIEKPVHMNWDTSGRLWVATSNTYPQVNPEDLAAQMKGDASKFGPSTGDDKIILLEDTDHDGVADVSRIVADQLLIPSGVAPDNLGGCYVGASTEVLHLTKPGADGKLSDRRIVLSGFGTEDTHHIVHTLQWGIDGRLYFHQTIYIHSHVETPWGLIRANSGVVFAYEPSTERLEVYSKGLTNAWGQQEDLSGQTFLTSGADGAGIYWAFPGATFPPSEGARRLIGSISPGSYPKFSGLELVHSPLFGADWQGNAITCDFRAHRIVRFGFNDLSVGAQPTSSGYVTKQLADVVRTSNSAFRPITPKMGPDGALYVADWSNPIINHGEVDFRDPRRDKVSGRIWRIAPQGSVPLKWEPLGGKKPAELLAKLLSPNRWEFEQARRELAKLPLAELRAALGSWAKDDVTRRHAAWLLSGRTTDTRHLEELLRSQDPASLQVGLREIGKAADWARRDDAAKVAPFLSHPNPRVQLEAFRALARIRTAGSANFVLARGKKNDADKFLDFATWLSTNELAQAWLEDLAGLDQGQAAGREEQLDALVKCVDPAVMEPFIRKLFQGRSIDADGTGPWVELIGKAGSRAELTLLYDALLRDPKLKDQTRRRVAAALLDAARVRDRKPDGDLSAIRKFFAKESSADLRATAVQLAGQWKVTSAIREIGEFAAREADPAARKAAFDALRNIGEKEGVLVLKGLVAENQPIAVRRGALVSLAAHSGSSTLAALPSVFAQTKDREEAVKLWRELFQIASFSQKIAKQFPQGLDPATLEAALQAARGLGRSGLPLVAAIEPLTGSKQSARDYGAEVQALLASIKQGADPAAGQLTYLRSGCAMCHAIGGAGGKLGPDMSSIGASAPLDYIIESVLNPASKVKEGYHAFAFSMKNGNTMVGIPSRENATEQFIRPGPGAEIPLLKADIVKRENIGSLMPAGLIDGLDKKAQRDLLAFLGEIGKPGPFDASKGNVARLWQFGEQRPGAAAIAVMTPVYTLVNGQLLKQFNPGLPYASARFTAAAKTTQPLKLTGVKAAWLDGKPLELRSGVSSAAIAAGDHVLTVEVDAAAPFLKAQCDDASFLGD